MESVVDYFRGNVSLTHSGVAREAQQIPSCTIKLLAPTHSEGHVIPIEDKTGLCWVLEYICFQIHTLMLAF